jgi:hypothetical protein
VGKQNQAGASFFVRSFFTLPQPIEPPHKSQTLPVHVDPSHCDCILYDTSSFIVPAILAPPTNYSIMSSTKRRNGLESPYSRMQMSTWITLPALVVQFLMFCTPVLPLAASIACTVVFCGACLAAALYGYVATVVDPMDSRLSHDGEEPENKGHLLRLLKVPARQQTQHSPGEAVNGHNHENDDEKTKYCWVCEHDVAEPSMHCRYCNKCVSKFDHHCQWLNTCIGERNYPYFYRTLWSIAVLLVVHMVVLLGLAIDILIGGPSKARAEDWCSANLSELVAAVNIFFFIFDFICISLILQLLLFHIKLRRAGLSTYQYILQDNAKKREQKKITQEKESRRIVAIGQAKRDSKSVLSVRLAMGKYFQKVHPCLDPLPAVEEEAPEQQQQDNGQAAVAAKDGENNELELSEP